MAEYIERKQVIELLLSYPIGTFAGNDIYSEENRTCRSEIEDIPAADVAPVVHGRWVYGEDVDIQCSVCGADAFTEGDYRQVKSRYCPNCGAKMDLED